MKGFTRSRTKLSDSDKNLMPFRAFVCSCRKSLVYLSFSAPTFVCPSGKVCPSNIVKVRNSSPVFRAHHDLRVYEEFLLYLHLVISLRSSKLVTKLLAHTHTEFLTKNFFFTDYDEQLANMEQNFWLGKIPKMYLWKLRYLAGK